MVKVPAEPVMGTSPSVGSVLGLGLGDQLLLCSRPSCVGLASPVPGMSVETSGATTSPDSDQPAVCLLEIQFPLLGHQLPISAWEAVETFYPSRLQGASCDPGQANQSLGPTSRGAGSGLSLPTCEIRKNIRCWRMSTWIQLFLKLVVINYKSIKNKPLGSAVS